MMAAARGEQGSNVVGGANRRFGSLIALADGGEFLHAIGATRGL